jgi:hypothetical protein
VGHKEADLNAAILDKNGHEDRIQQDFAETDTTSWPHDKAAILILTLEFGNVKNIYFPFIVILK